MSMAIITDSKSRVIYYNEAFEEETGYGEEIMGRRPDILKSGHHSKMYYKHLYETLRKGEKWVGKFQNRRKDGTTYFEDAAIFPVTMGGSLYYCKTSVNTTKAEELSTEKYESTILASQIQQSLIPEDRQDDNLIIRSKYLPLERVSGDIYNHYQLGESTYAIFLADVVGHGIASALLTTSILTIANGLIQSDPMPDTFLKRLNNKMIAKLGKSNLPQTTYFTAAYLLVDTKAGTLHYANCGHPKMYLLRDGDIQDFCEVNFFVGLFKDAVYDYGTLTIQPGDELFLYSDGIVEVDGNVSDGEQSLESSLKSYHKHKEGISLPSYIHNNCLLATGLEANDDITLLSVEIL